MRPNERSVFNQDYSDQRGSPKRETHLAELATSRHSFRLTHRTYTAARHDMRASALAPTQTLAADDNRGVRARLRHTAALNGCRRLKLAAGGSSNTSFGTNRAASSATALSSFERRNQDSRRGPRLPRCSPIQVHGNVDRGGGVALPTPKRSAEPSALPCSRGNGGRAGSGSPDLYDPAAERQGAFRNRTVFLGVLALRQLPGQPAQCSND